LQAPHRLSSIDCRDDSNVADEEIQYDLVAAMSKQHRAKRNCCVVRLSRLGHAGSAGRTAARFSSTAATSLPPSR
jgi:hypothetical protein